MRAVFKRNPLQWLLGGALSCAATVCAQPSAASDQPVCQRPLYLTFDTGHMGVAPLVSDILDRQKVVATFFLANEPTRTGGMSLDEVWAPWWKSMSEKGHVFASHTFDHVYWLADLPGNQFKVRPSSGPDAGKIQSWSAQQYCEELSRADARFEKMTGRQTLPVFRAAGGKTSPDLIQAAASCGYAHVSWSAAGFLGDELSSGQYPNTLLLERALKNIRAGDILMAHLGIWSRQDPWAPAVLEPLLIGLKQKGFCFATMAEHPDYRAWIKKYARSAKAEQLDAVLQSQDDVMTRPLEPTDIEFDEEETDDAVQKPQDSPTLGQDNLAPKDIPTLDITTEKNVKNG